MAYTVCKFASGLNKIIQFCSRNGAWLSIGNLALQLIPGTPAVHPDDDLIVGHIAIEVESEHMSKIREGLQQLGWQSRKNVSVPNPDKANTPVDQVTSPST